MIDIQKWDKASRQEKMIFVEGLMSLADLYCVGKEEWETICRFMLDEVHSCKLLLAEYANKTDEQSQIIKELKARASNENT